MMQKVFITRQFPNTALRMIKDAGFIVNMWDSSEPVDYNYMIDKSRDVAGIICTINDKINDDFINSSKNLKVISTMSVGFDHIDISAVRKRNIRIGYTPGVLTDATAELAVGLLLSVSRRLIEGVNAVKNGTWGAWKPFWMCGYGLKNSVVGIVGLGSIGTAIAKRVNSFGVKQILASGSSKPNERSVVEIESNVHVYKVCFDELIASSDFIIVSCSLNENTKDLFNEIIFDKMKKNAILINISRGPVINQDSLCKALIEGKIAGAGLDVCCPEPLPIDHPLLKLSNCVILPHIGSATIETRNEMCKVAVENLIQGLQGVAMTTELKLLN